MAQVLAFVQNIPSKVSIVMNLRYRELLFRTVVVFQILYKERLFSEIRRRVQRRLGETRGRK